MSMATLNDLGKTYYEELKRNPSELNIFNIATRINGLVWKGTAQKLETQDKMIIINSIFKEAPTELQAIRSKLEKSVGI